MSMCQVCVCDMMLMGLDEYVTRCVCDMMLMRLDEYVTR